MTEIDLGFNPLQPRDQDGRWVRGGGVVSALKNAPAGSIFETKGGPHLLGKAMEGETGNRHAVTFKSNKNGDWEGPENWGPALSSEAVSKTFKAGRVLTPADQRIRHNRVMNKRDSARLARTGSALDNAAPGSTFTGKASTFEAVARLGPGQVTLTRNSSGSWDTETAPRGQTAKELHGNAVSIKDWTPSTMTSAEIRQAFGTNGHVAPPTRKAHPMDKRTRAQNAKRLLDKFLGHPGDMGNGDIWSPENDLRLRRRLQFSNLTEQDVIDLSTILGREIDLDWAAWNQGHRKTGVGPRQVKAFKKSAGLKGTTHLGKPAQSVLQRRASKPGHFRAKAILAAANGNASRARKMEVAKRAAVAVRKNGGSQARAVRVGRATAHDAHGNGQITSQRASQAIAKFQKVHGLKVTGDYNRQTANRAKTAATNHKHMLARAVNQISKAETGAHWRANQRRAARIVGKMDARRPHNGPKPPKPPKAPTPLAPPRPPQLGGPPRKPRTLHLH